MIAQSADQPIVTGQIPMRRTVSHALAVALTLTAAGMAHGADAPEIAEFDGAMPALKVGGYLVTAVPEYGSVVTDDQARVTDKPLLQLEAKLHGALEPDSVILSGSAKGKALFERSNATAKFPILSRFPGQHEGTEGSHFILSNAVAATTR